LTAHPWFTVSTAFAVGLWVLLGTVGVLVGQHTAPRHTTSPQLSAGGARTAAHAPGTPTTRAARPVRHRSEIAQPGAPWQRPLPRHSARATAQPALPAAAARVKRTSVATSVGSARVSEPTPPAAGEQTSGGLFSP
jgi:hypothetical protein